MKFWITQKKYKTGLQLEVALFSTHIVMWMYTYINTCTHEFREFLKATVSAALRPNTQLLTSYYKSTYAATSWSVDSVWQRVTILRWVFQNFWGLIYIKKLLKITLEKKSSNLLHCKTNLTLGSSLILKDGFQEILYSGPIPIEEININCIHCKNIPELTKQFFHFYESVSKQGSKKVVICRNRQLTIIPAFR